MKTIEQSYILELLESFEKQCSDKLNNCQGLAQSFINSPSFDHIECSIGWVCYEGLEEVLNFKKINEIGFLMLGWVLKKQRAAELFMDGDKITISIPDKGKINMQDVLSVTDLEDPDEVITLSRQLEITYELYIGLP